MDFPKTGSRRQNEKLRKEQIERAISDNWDAIEHDLHHGMEPLRSLGTKYGVPEYHIYKICDNLGIDKKERRRRILEQQGKDRHQETLNRVLRGIRKDPSSLNLNLSSLAKRFRCSAYTIDEALKIIGEEPGKKTEGFDAICPASQKLMRMAWVNNPPATWNYWGCGV